MKVKVKSGSAFQWDLTVNPIFVKNKVNRVLNDDQTRIEIHNALARICYPYVPMDEGILMTTTETTPDYLRYNVPYAHYMYVGEVYGPNIPIIENGIVVGWFSIPGKKKSPTGKQINYSKEKHPLATKEWDKVAIAANKDKFEKEVKEIIKRRMKQL